MLKKCITVILPIILTFFFSACSDPTSIVSNTDFYITDETEGSETFIMSNFDESSRVIKGKSTKSKTDKTSTYPTSLKSISITKNNRYFFKTVGRGIPISGGGLNLNWSASSVEFSLDCKDEIRLTFDLEEAKAVSVRVIVDGEQLKTPIIIEYSGEFTVCKNLKSGVHSVKLIRLTDPDGGSLKLNKIRTYGSLVEKRPQNATLYIEAIGDQNLLGMGLLYNGEKSLENTEYSKFQDPTKTYTYLAAQKLKADTYSLARDKIGVGVTIRYTQNDLGKLTPDINGGTLSQLYKREKISSSLEYVCDRRPDIIVIDCGRYDTKATFQNMMQEQSGEICNTDTVKNDTIKFLKYLKGQNVNAKIIWCCSLDEKSKEHIKEIIKILGGDKSGFYYLELATSKQEYPSHEEHKTNAQILANKIKNII